jgi:hypothetical protein
MKVKTANIQLYKQEYNDKYYEKNKDNIKAYHVDYYQKNKERILEYQKKYYNEHKEQIALRYKNKPKKYYGASPQEKAITNNALKPKEKKKQVFLLKPNKPVNANPFID